MADQAPTFKIEDAQLIFRNFEGKEGQFNDAGDKNFCVLLDDETAATLAADGWNIKELRAREEGDEPRPYLQVKVNYKQRPPRVVMITSAGRTTLDDSSVAVLDWADIETADLICRGYAWTVGEKSGIKAYLQSLYITIQEDELDLKYSGVPEAHYQDND